VLNKSSSRYQADHVYSLATVYFMVAVIGVFMISHIITRFSDSTARSKSPLGRFISVVRFAEYRTFHLYGWISPTLGVLLLTAVGVIYFSGQWLGSLIVYQRARLTVDFRPFTWTKTILLAKYQSASKSCFLWKFTSTCDQDGIHGSCTTSICRVS
jgi:TctA family transporter